MTESRATCGLQEKLLSFDVAVGVPTAGLAALVRNFLVTLTEVNFFDADADDPVACRGGVDVREEGVGARKIGVGLAGPAVCSSCSVAEAFPSVC